MRREREEQDEYERLKSLSGKGTKNLEDQWNGMMRG